MNDKKTHKSAFDPVLLFPALLLTGIGVIMIYSASSEIAIREYANEYYFFTRQLLFAVVGILAMWVCRYIPYRIYRPLTYILMIISFGLLGLVLVDGVGHTAGGATRWLRLGMISFQPSEFARIALIIFMAYSLTRKQQNVERFFIGFIPHVAMLVIFTLLIYKQPDFGTIAIFWMLTWIVMFAGRVRLAHLFSACIAVLPVAIFALGSAEYRLNRWITFLDPWKYPRDEGYQIIHSLLGFGSGGLLGKGFGQGYQKLFYLPTPHTDFILSVIGEEGGLVMVLIVLALYMILLWRGMWIAITARDYFGSLLAFGITASITLQSAVNMGVNLSLLPTKGLALPFLSYGGSSLVFNLVCIGILMNISTARARV